MTREEIEVFNPERIKFIVWNFNDSRPEINIDGENLIYAQVGTTHHGLQCNHIGNTTEHNLIQEKCKKISELFREITELNKLKEQQ